ncbi:hypothetical protein HYV86_00855 [Candidatus Woesearchaeota archaeon]|nr:hypothetical protein [Candidatus Woesearchaeota archaeon]
MLRPQPDYHKLFFRLSYPATIVRDLHFPGSRTGIAPARNEDLNSEALNLYRSLADMATRASTIEDWLDVLIERKEVLSDKGEMVKGQFRLSSLHLAFPYGSAFRDMQELGFRNSCGLYFPKTPVSIGRVRDCLAAPNLERLTLFYTAQT